MKRIALLCLSWCCGIAASAQNNIHEVEYFFNSDPGYGSGIDVPITPAFTLTDLSFDADISALVGGFNMLYIRARNDSGWSVAAVKPIYIFPSSAISLPNITALEYFVDSDPGFGAGTGLSITPGTTLTNFAFNVATGSLTAGFHTLNVRAQDASGRWSVCQVKSFYILPATAISTPDVVKLEYFIDDDPGFGAAIDVPFSAGTTITDLSFNIDTDTLSAGFHTLNIRAQDANGVWSPAFVKSIFMLPATAISLPAITKVEYFVDDDPGFGAAVDVPITAATSVIDLPFVVSMDTLTEGFHTLNIRAQDENGVWCAAFVKSVFVLGSGAIDITKLEYFFDADPGFGAGIDVPVVSGPQVTNFAFAVATDTLSYGFHLLTVRAQDGNGTWSTAFNQPVFISVNESVNLVALEYFFDTDPGVGNGTEIPVSPVISIDSLVVGANISALAVGPHWLYIRARDSNGVWSTTESYPFEACIQDEPIVGQAEGLSYDSFVANWAAAEDALTYQLDVSTDTLQTFLPGFASKSLTVLRDTLVSLTPLTHYQYRVRALGPDNCLSINSDTIYVRTNSTLIIDTEALMALYNQAGGSNWTNKTGWLSSGLADNTWHGVTVENENVVAVDLSENNLVGVVPDSVLNISLMHTLNLSGNEVSAVPDFSDLLNIDTINVSDNRLDFGDLENNRDVTGINYNNQKDIGNADTDTVNVSHEYTHSVVVAGSANAYQWKKDEANITDANSSTYPISSFAKADQGVYQCIITSPLFPGMVLKSAPTTLLGVATISGTLLVNGTTPATEGSVQLLKITEGGYDSIPASPMPVNSNGTFTFNNIFLHNYLLVGLADTLTYERALPTYVPNTAYWEEADTIELLENINDLQIVTVFEPDDQLTGEGLLFGIVQEDDGTGSRGQVTKRVGGAGVSARRTQGTGKGKEVLEIVGYVFTNEEGEFSIAGLPPGEYVFNVQYPGYPMDETTFIDFEIGSTPLDEAVQVEATVESGNIKVRELIITHVYERLNFKADVYPNPSTGVVNVQFEAKDISRSISLKDANGRILTTQSAAESFNVLDVSRLQAGVYLMTIVNKNGTQKMVKVAVKH